ncbi:hypothetical protein [Kitasatospora sp. LaBMicrA B282]|uniref:hypothetical protein n=1 Tax=Kitasatospora sp. LaBMicrA B282 TaxID=3420949 RepID=UPI003D12D738
MSFLGMWCVVPMRADAIMRYVPDFAPAIEAQATDPDSLAFLQRWRASGSTEAGRHDFVESAAPCVLDEKICLVYEAWEHGRDPSLPYLAVAARNSYPAAGLAYALGPECFAHLPGWMGDFILTPDQVRHTLPDIERAFTWTPATRRHAAQLLTAALRDECAQDDLDALLDGLPPLWRAATDAGRGLLAAHFIP